MAFPRVFVSSTCYDLKYIRENLKYFIRRLGYEPVLSEEGSVFFDPNLHTHDACIAEVPNCQIFVVIIGGRFGAQFKSETHSITNAEYREAVRLKIPIFAIVEQGVYNESRVYLRNKDRKTIDARSIIYPSADNVSIFDFIEEVKSNTINNATVPFKDFSDIESFLLQQWAGMMYSFLTRDNENARVTDTLAIMKEMNERVEMLSRQILRSVGTHEAKIAAELYDEMLSYDVVRIISYMGRRPTPQVIIENNNLDNCALALDLKFKINKKQTGYSYSVGGDISKPQHDVIAKSYAALRAKLLEIIKRHDMTPEQYIAISKRSEQPIETKVE
jgi:hypothetical protein